MSLKNCLHSKQLYAGNWLNSKYPLIPSFREKGIKPLTRFSLTDGQLIFNAFFAYPLTSNSKYSLMIRDGSNRNSFYKCLFEDSSLILAGKIYRSLLT